MDSERAAERDFVVRTAQENDVKFIRLWFTDILGHLKGFAITVEDLEDAIEQGVGFDGAAIEGFARIDESDMRAFPDPTQWPGCFATSALPKESRSSVTRATPSNAIWSGWPATDIPTM